MKELTYPAVFEPSKTGYGVYFPDFPGCITVGDNFEHAYAMAKEVLELHISDFVEDGEAMPPPSDKPEVFPETNEGYFVVPVTIYPDDVEIDDYDTVVEESIIISARLKNWAAMQGINLSKTLQSTLQYMYEVRQG